MRLIQIRSTIPTGRPRPEVVVDAMIFAAIVAVAAVTRLTSLDLVEFVDDEPRVASLAVALLEGRLLPLVGISSSVGVNNPPAFVYLMAIPLALSRDPAVAMGFIALLDVVAVLLCYRLCDDYFDRRTAQVAALLFASAPGAIVFSRKIQEQDAVPFFVVLLVGSIFHLVSGRGHLHLLGVALWLNLLIQLHLASLALVPLVALALAYYWWRVERFQLPWRWIGSAVALTLALWIPFIVFQLTHDLIDLRATLALVRQPAQVSFDNFQFVVDLASGNAFVGKTGDGAPRYLAETLSFDGLYLAEKILFLVSVAFIAGRLAWTRGRSSGDWRYAFLLLWMIVPPLVFAHHSMPLYSHYFLTVFPAQFLAMGLLISQGECWLARRIPKAIPGMAATVLIGALVASQVYGSITVMDYIGRASTLGSHGVPLREKKLAIDRAIALTGGSPKPVYVPYSTQGYPLAFAYLAADRVSLRAYDDTASFVVPADDGAPTIYLTSDPNQPSAQFLQSHLGRYLVSTVPFPGLADGFDLYRLSPDAGSQLLRLAEVNPLDRALPNGMHLRGYELGSTIRVGQPVRLGIYWQVDFLPPPGEEYAFFTHLIDDQGKTWGQQDGLGYPPMLWHLGDTVVSSFTLTASPPGPAVAGSIELGVYRRRDVARLPLQAPDGTTIDHVLLGPLKVRSGESQSP